MDNEFGRKKKKSVCVIGAGASGLAVMKELKKLGHAVQCFDENVRIGGVYTKSYDRTMLTTSSLLTAYSEYSDGLEAKPKFWTDEEYLDYLDGFACEFGLYDDITFRSSVTRVTPRREDKEPARWEVVVDTGTSYVWPHRSTFLLGRKCTSTEKKEEARALGSQVLSEFHGEGAAPFEEAKKDFCYDYFDHVSMERKRMAPTSERNVQTLTFDAVCVCTGTNTWASLPTFDGADQFEGTIIHAENYKKAEVFRKKRVLIVGAGESGSDICKEIAEEAEKVAIVVRGKHGHVIPRRQSDGRVTDLNTNRCRYSNPYIFGDWIGYVNQLAKKLAARASSNLARDDKMILQKIGELNMYQRTSAFSKFGCKNEGFVTAMVMQGAELHRDTFYLTKDEAVFADGSRFKADAVVACTGYRNAFPMLLPQEDATEAKNLASFCQNPRNLYKQIFCPFFEDGSLAFFGFARPAFGSIPPTAEMQAKFFALVLDGQLALPSTEKMRTVARRDQANWESRFGYDAKRVKGLVDFQLYCDDLAKEMDCLPPLRKIFLSSPSLWVKLMFGPFVMHQYILTGPFANPKRAIDVYQRQPVGDLLESSITALFLFTAKFLSILGFKRFTPNNF